MTNEDARRRPATPGAAGPPTRLKLVLGRDASTDALLLSQRRGPGVHDAITVVVERQGGGPSAAYEARGISATDLYEIRQVLESATEGNAGPTTLSAARELLARATLQARIAGRETTAPFRLACAWVGGVDQAIAALPDIFPCASCGGPLPGGAQLALARGELQGPVRCDHCRGADAAMTQPLTRFVPLWIARAQLLLDAREPRLALALAAHAEGEGARGPALDRIRGWAYLALGNAGAAVAHLRRAVQAEPGELLTRTLLVVAESQAELHADATAHLEQIIAAQPAADQVLAPVRMALDSLRASGPTDAREVRALCFAALEDMERELAPPPRPGARELEALRALLP